VRDPDLGPDEADRLWSRPAHRWHCCALVVGTAEEASALQRPDMLGRNWEGGAIPAILDRLPRNSSRL